MIDLLPTKAIYGLSEEPVTVEVRGLDGSR